MNQLAERRISARALLISISVALTLAMGNVQAAEPVTVQNFVRAESDHMIRAKTLSVWHIITTGKDSRQRSIM